MKLDEFLKIVFVLMFWKFPKKSGTSNNVTKEKHNNIAAGFILYPSNA